jgi:hypothetical protein
MTSRREFMRGSAHAAALAAQTSANRARDGAFEISGSGLVFSFEVVQGNCGSAIFCRLERGREEHCRRFPTRHLGGHLKSGQ